MQTDDPVKLFTDKSSSTIELGFAVLPSYGNSRFENGMAQSRVRRGSRERAADTAGELYNQAVLEIKPQQVLYSRAGIKIPLEPNITGN